MRHYDAQRFISPAFQPFSDDSHIVALSIRVIIDAQVIAYLS